MGFQQVSFNCYSIENSFWVGKSSLRSWRRLVTEKLGVTSKSHSQQQKADEQGETETNDQGDSVDKTEDSALDACENKGDMFVVLSLTCKIISFYFQVIEL